MAKKSVAAFVHGKSGGAAAEDTAAWVRFAMYRLKPLEYGHCQKNSGELPMRQWHGRKLAFIKELMQASNSMDEFTNQKSVWAAGLYCSEGAHYLQFKFHLCPMPAMRTNWIHPRGANVYGIQIGAF